MKFCGVPSKISNSQILKKVYSYNELWYKMFSAKILCPIGEKNTVKYAYNEVQGMGNFLLYKRNSLHPSSLHHVTKSQGIKITSL